MVVIIQLFFVIIPEIEDLENLEINYNNNDEKNNNNNIINIIDIKLEEKIQCFYLVKEENIHVDMIIQVN